MDDRDDTPADELQPDDVDRVEMRRQLDGVASTVEVGDLEMARADVGVRVGRRRTRKRVGAAIGAVAVVAAATAAVFTIGGDDPDTLVTTDDTEVPASTLADDDVDAPQPTLPTAPSDAAQGVELVEGAARVAASAGANGAPEYGEWMVPWEDGFLVGSTSFPPQPLPDELPEEVVALFPQEVIDLFGGDLPDTISEATEQLSEAGLLDVVSEIIANNPEASEAIYGAPADTPPTLDVRFTADGETWEPREMVLPPEATYLSSTAAVGDRIVVVYSIIDPLTGMPADGRVVVAATSDLINWTTQDIVLPPPGELPEGVTWSVNAQGLVANDTGWVVPVYSSIDIDPYSLLPEEIRLGIDDSNGVSVGTTGDGIMIESDFDDEGNPTNSQSLTWEELGVDPAVVELVAEQEYTPTLWAASWDGVPAATDGPLVQGPMAATSSGFVTWTDQTWFSADGVSWTASPLPQDDAFVSGAFVVDDGLIVLSSTNDGGHLVHRVDERGGDAVLLDVDIVPDGLMARAGWTTGTATAGMIVEATPTVSEDDMLSVDVDGYRLTIDSMSGDLVVTDVATGETVASQQFSLESDDDGSPITIDETGVTALDPETGEVLVVFSIEAIDAAQQDLFEEGDGVYLPDFWLLASLDGERFVIDDLDDSDQGPTALVSNGGRLLVQAGGSWLVYDLT